MLKTFRVKRTPYRNPIGKLRKSNWLNYLGMRKNLNIKTKYITFYDLVRKRRILNAPLWHTLQ